MTRARDSVLPPRLPAGLVLSALAFETVDSPAKLQRVDWIAPIVAGLITGTLAFGAVAYAQFGSRRAWARDQRREAHLAFLSEQRRLDHWMMRVTRMGKADVETPGEGWFLPLERLLHSVQVFGGQEAAIAARKLFVATIKLDDGTLGVMQAADQALEDYRRAVQSDLGMRPTNLPEWRGDESL